MLPLTHHRSEKAEETQRGHCPKEAAFRILRSNPVLMQFSWCGGYRKPDPRSFGTFHGLDSVDPGPHSFQHWQGRLILQVWKVQRNLHIPNRSQIHLYCLNSAQLTLLRSNTATFLWPGRECIQGTLCETGRIYECLKCISGELSLLDRADNRAEQLSQVWQDPVQLWVQE